MVGDGHVHDPATLVCEDHEDEQQTVRHGGDDEEIRSHDLRDVIRQAGPPGLRGRLSSFSSSPRIRGAPRR